MAQVQVAEDGRALVVLPAGAPPRRVHPLWLRERCEDAGNVDSATGQRLYNPSELDETLSITAIDTRTPGAFRVAFSDGSCGNFAEADILAQLPGADQPGEPAPVPWTAQMPAQPNLDWRDCGNPATRLQVLHDYLTQGYVVFSHVPCKAGAVLDVARCFGFPRETNFGVLFDVRSVPDANDLAYTPLPLDPHTDNPYRAPVPGIQLLHCICNETPGGLSTLVDGFAVAEALRAESPAQFDSLTRIAVSFRYTDSETELVASAPLIELTPAGRFAAIHFSPRLDFVPLLEPEALAQFYTARRRLNAMLKSARFERRFRLEAGDLMMFNNARLLHGRTGFDPRAGLRHLQGCYIDADGPASQYRVLRRQKA